MEQAPFLPVITTIDLVVDTDHNVAGFDNRVSGFSFGEAQGFNGFFGHDGSDLGSAGQFDNHFRTDGAEDDFLYGSFKCISGTEFHI